MTRTSVKDENPDLTRCPVHRWETSESLTPHALKDRHQSRVSDLAFAKTPSLHQDGVTAAGVARVGLDARSAAVLTREELAV